ncbi:MAG: alpha-mannosidase [Armatimonadota bacterium]
MDFIRQLDKLVVEIKGSKFGNTPQCERLISEINFARMFSEVFPDKKAEWEGIIIKASESLRDKLTGGGCFDLDQVMAETEGIMAPIGNVAKEYTIHCCGHAHIDMDWMWPWPETVSICHDTFTTVNKLMDEYPDFKFTQSQISVYAAMEELCPEVFEMIKKRIAEGRWEPAATMWVEGDKNIASGEILCRHLLYSKRYLKEKFDIPYDEIKIDWEPDTFGHAWTLPTILNKGGVTRYGYGRMAPDKWLFWWKAPDGSKVLSFYYSKLPGFSVDLPMDHLTTSLVDYVKENGLKDFMTFYGVGDHGGGPTRQMLMKALEADSRPIYPNFKLSTMDAYYSAVEAQDLSHLYVQDDEINFVFDGCYTSESSVKLANRVSENVLPEVEALSLIAGYAAKFPYPTALVNKAWRMAMFNQFHDILPGSGIRATYMRAEGQFQEIQSIADTIRTRAMRQLAMQIDTSKAFDIEPPTGNMGAGVGAGIGGGAGDLGLPGGVSAYGAGSVIGDPFVVYNQMPFPRTEMVAARVWNKDVPPNMVSVRSDDGKVVMGQVIESGNYWLYHNYITVVFPAEQVPGLGYRTYIIERDPTPPINEGVKFTSPDVMENEYLRVEFDNRSGGIRHLIDKATGYDYVPENELMGVLEYCHEAAQGMSSWTIGQIMSIEKITEEGLRIKRWEGYDMGPDGGLPWSFARTENPFPPTDFPVQGPHRCMAKFGHKVKNSKVWVEVGLNAGSRMIDFRVVADWREIGTPATGVPMLRIAFPTSMVDTKGTYEIPFGSIERPSNGQEVPALKWADLSGKKVGADGECGITMVNSYKYGHNADDNTFRLTLIRSSFNPDPVPEVSRHDIRLAIIPHDGPCDVSQAAREGAAFNQQMVVVSTDIHEGTLDSTKGFVEVLTPNVMVASVKKAEDSEALIVRLYETEGKETEAQVRITDLAALNSPAREVDIIEQPMDSSTAKMDGDILKVNLPAHGMTTVMVG